MRRILLALSAVLLPGTVSAADASTAVPDGSACLAAISAVERASRLPPDLMRAIGILESGRLDAATRRVAPWPWTINVAGTGHFFETKAAAIAAVDAARSAGVQSIDVGCMQINLLHHPAAFASLDLAFDPVANVTYAARFLTQLFQQTSNWHRAAAAYHSSTPEIGEPYGERVAALWPAAARYRPPPGPAAAVRDLARAVDPHDIYTPEFRARLLRDAADRANRMVELRGPSLRARLQEQRPASRVADAGRPTQDALTR
ncbi:lytic transglycosylase domain-containing protein [Roseomonas sp. BN140053]|uniref:lytic transglycosylase domain-containing protein n=1 Tax=Roseomonas sp. BN140053 TaxID=3391898 RepID=UPI0039EC4358